jgi:hypothetical protein
MIVHVKPTDAQLGNTMIVVVKRIAIVVSQQIFELLMGQFSIIDGIRTLLSNRQITHGLRPARGVVSN